ncbi:hypothetical protein DFJ58DRAFT_777423 [Suillus subalutaceus]|uniref:uncharacterized protein n=1 Tax=Suillus subalutaceus TaxID=48586 RepID=UPI001B88015C|nr:uncharacterized protein DFJ58DRAFT_777423 [Suillus subalutaceus]KAG1861570.1 hypothetical protein DFJ58DRAFT_777423 [Suillus subalutaceus]
MGLGIKQVIDEPELHILPSGYLFNMSSESFRTATYRLPWTWVLKQNNYGLEPHTLPSESLVSSKVPLKFYDIKVVQFWRGEKEHLRPYPLHWAICVETRPDIGNTYQLVGDQTNYAIDIKLNQRLPKSDERGSYSVGSVSSTELDEMETTLRRVDIIHNLPCWNSQDWVDDALRYLKCWGFSDIIGETKLANLQDRMCWMLESWPGILDAVEFVGDSEDLACVLSSRRCVEIHRYYWKSRAEMRRIQLQQLQWDLILRLREFGPRVYW